MIAIIGHKRSRGRLSGLVPHNNALLRPLTAERSASATSFTSHSRQLLPTNIHLFNAMPIVYCRLHANHNKHGRKGTTSSHVLSFTTQLTRSAEKNGGKLVKSNLRAEAMGSFSPIGCVVENCAKGLGPSMKINQHGRLIWFLPL